MDGHTFSPELAQAASDAGTQIGQAAERQARAKSGDEAAGFGDIALIAAFFFPARNPIWLYLRLFVLLHICAVTFRLLPLYDEYHHRHCDNE